MLIKLEYYLVHVQKWNGHFSGKWKLTMLQFIYRALHNAITLLHLHKICLWSGHCQPSQGAEECQSLVWIPLLMLKVERKMQHPYPSIRTWISMTIEISTFVTSSSSLPQFCGWELLLHRRQVHFPGIATIAAILTAVLTAVNYALWRIVCSSNWGRGRGH